MKKSIVLHSVSTGVVLFAWFVPNAGHPVVLYVLGFFLSWAAVCSCFVHIKEAVRMESSKTVFRFFCVLHGAAWSILFLSLIDLPFSPAHVVVFSFVVGLVSFIGCGTMKVPDKA